MAIPKDPRGLMVNLMYLVLTAMLALNVSAEIINAFFMLHKGLKTTNNILEENTKGVLGAISSKKETKPEAADAELAAKEIQRLTKEFVNSIEVMRKDLVAASVQGTYEEGIYPEDYEDKKKAGKPKKYKDKDTPQNYFVMEGKGAELKESVMNLRMAFIAEYKKLLTKEGFKIADEAALAADIAKIESTLPLQLDDQTWQDMKKPNWESYVFGYMPIAACYPLLSKFQNDAIASQALIVSTIAGKIGATTMKFDQFEAVSSASRSYIMPGETYEAELFLGAYSSEASIGIKVNGTTKTVKDGKATYTALANTPGPQQYNVKITLKNPNTGKVDEFSKKFEYEVGVPSASVSATAMNVIYAGLENPIAVAAAGIPTSRLVVTGSPFKLQKSGKNYMIKPAKALKKGQFQTITIKDRDGKLESASFRFRVLSLPPPTPMFTFNDASSGVLRAQQ